MAPVYVQSQSHNGRRSQQDVWGRIVAHAFGDAHVCFKRPWDSKACERMSDALTTAHSRQFSTYASKRSVMSQDPSPCEAAAVLKCSDRTWTSAVTILRRLRCPRKWCTFRGEVYLSQVTVRHHNPRVDGYPQHCHELVKRSYSFGTLSD